MVRYNGFANAIQPYLIYCCVDLLLRVCRSYSRRAWQNMRWQISLIIMTCCGDPPIVSGCFMLFRTDVLQLLGGFDPRFFLYFEDFDISLRAGKISRIAYVPQVKVVHHGGHASRKGWRHIWMFGRSMVTFFNIHGWRWW
ncbi:glycosyltransferase [Aeromonas hydrophila]|nr:glycosyltransferase [Aeromonas hydrophila]WES91767.1 glycosyltransferase [Aeromonas hydrophila]